MLTGKHSPKACKISTSEGEGCVQLLEFNCWKSGADEKCQWRVANLVVQSVPSQPSCKCTQSVPSCKSGAKVPRLVAASVSQQSLVSSSAKACDTRSIHTSFHILPINLVLNIFKYDTGWFISLVPPNFSTKKKTAKQPITAQDLLEQQLWLADLLFSFWYWNCGVPVK